MADDEPLSSYLDALIRGVYVTTERGVGHTVHAVSHEQFVSVIEDPDLGRPTDDPGDHYLLRAFDRVRRDLLHAPVIQGDGSRGSILMRQFPSDVEWTVVECNECDGYSEVPERCPTCGHMWDHHLDDDSGGPLREDTVFFYCDRCDCNAGTLSR